jgi:antagonist of KipI
MSLHVVDPGLYTLVVDFGRPHCRSLGVPVGGAADRASLALGNALVGNLPDTAGLEFSLSGPTLRAECDLACVVYGAPFELSSDRQRLRPGKTFTLHAGEELRIGGTVERVRGYLCVGGGLRTQVILDSRSSLEPLQAGAELPCSPGIIHSRFLRVPPFENDAQVLRIVDGPQVDWFSEKPLTRTFTVAPASNRMGLRFQGNPLPVPDRELVSEPVCPGAVQVTRDGQCIILGVDGQTIGGYPKIAQVISADLDAVGQLRPGQQIAFQRVSLEDAVEIHRRRQAELNSLCLRVRVALASLYPPHAASRS